MSIVNVNPSLGSGAVGPPSSSSSSLLLGPGGGPRPPGPQLKYSGGGGKKAQQQRANGSSKVARYSGAARRRRLKVVLRRSPHLTLKSSSTASSSPPAGTKALGRVGYSASYTGSRSRSSPAFASFYRQSASKFTLLRGQLGQGRNKKKQRGGGAMQQMKRQGRHMKLQRVVPGGLQAYLAKRKGLVLTTQVRG